MIALFAALVAAAPAYVLPWPSLRRERISLIVLGLAFILLLERGPGREHRKQQQIQISLESLPVHTKKIYA